MSYTFTKQSLTAQAALDVIEACRRKAVELDHPFVITVVDESGRVKASLAMDGAALISSQIANDKAYTAAGFGISTDAWHEFIKGDEPLRLGAPTGIDRLVTFGGGYPLIVGGQIVGGVGVSGGHYNQDMDVAQAGVDVLAA